ncbi:hypothetical protein FLX56_05275 [Synechococcus moorigangaii CMS01]|nr:hypothetical protein [Synechococcus moorigangaii CMS01]
MWRQSTKLEDQGFTFLEVLAGILIATTFVLVATQAIVIATVFRVRAQRQSEAINWIQKNLEGIQFQAALDISVTVGGVTCDPENSTSMGYGKALMEIVAEETIDDSDPPSKVEESFSETFVNQSYTITRTMSVYDRLPYNVVQVAYAVRPAEAGVAGAPIAELTTEVIADEAFDCY